MSYSSHLYGSFDALKVLEIPYRILRGDNKKYCMQFILPKKMDSLKELLREFHEKSGFINKDFELSKSKLTDLAIPKFKFSISVDGIRFPFMERNIELKEMFQGGEDFSISNIIQKAFTEVDETGTKSVVVTCKLCPCYAPPEEQEIKSFVVDHPFLFVEKEENSGVFLFIGAVVNPLVE
ncbi:hypothetical protein ACH5RR_018890 [Cinchona calisaya]|uniref:Serpin domain-containing protein n=1 Tax=Cinchona calisaya TaxID=153742 RepID=A0ABD2ZMW3_9GENT